MSSSGTVGSRSTMIKLPASPRDSPSVRSPGGSGGGGGASIRSPRHHKKKNTRRIQQQHLTNRLGGGGGLHVNTTFNFSIPEDSEVIIVPPHGDSTKGAVEAKNSPRKNKDENSNSNNNITLQMAEEVATETAARANVMMNSCAVERCAVELPSDRTRLALQPKLTTPTAPTEPAVEKKQPITNSNKNSDIPRVRSKKVLVIDPGSGKKCHLTRDDHSLTDKELHVYHQQKRSQQQQKQQQQRARRVGSEDDSEVDEEEKTAATFQTNATGHTMVSALTEVSYVKNKWEMLPLSPILFGKKAAAEDRRDDDEVVEVGHYKQLLMDMRDPALMPDDDAENERFRWLGCLSPGGNMERELGPVPYRRIPMVIFPNELQRCMEEEDETLMGMKLVQSADDFQAHVSTVLKGSKAYRIGIRKGDVLSFAVALSNVDKDDGVMADKIIKRLESVGMRTSYRELYDIFLSKTTSCRPIGLVFRRCLRNSAPVTINSTRINDEFEWSTDFLQALTIKCREYEFEKKVPFQDKESFDADAVPFVSCPNVSLEENTFVSNYLDMVGNIADYFFVNKPTREEDNFLSYRTLRSLVEQSVALAFVCQGNKPQNGSTKTTGTGFVVVRSDHGSWSPPCFLSMMGNESHQTRSFKNANMIVICKKELLDQLMSGSVVHFNAPESELADVLALDSVIIGLEGGRFHPMQNTSIAIKTSESQNQGAYLTSFGQRVGNENIVDGQVLPPEQSVDFYGALQSLELPHSMHAHPVVPDKIEPYCNNDWAELDQYLSPRNGGMAMIFRHSSHEDRHEIDIFTRRLKYYLMDGVPVQMVSSSTSDNNDERELRLTIANTHSLSDSCLELSGKRKPGMVGSAPQGNFSTSFESITKLSRQPPSSLHLDEEDKRRFFSLETDLSAGPIMMLAKNKRDAELLLAGLKLLLEREKILG
ncbi:hypothetical protein QTG54_011020 [Skeletonema marinoi]|uniref:Uncharacterized protein n=1 Tax=Skeletonema marinoi TaxID=267567 RepID=A0AAD8Y2C8_9STRA|nr:hypothetical protein QTG54_011020 [Skeletonema marinoi]